MDKILDLDPSEIVLFKVRQHPIVIVQIVALGSIVALSIIIGFAVIINSSTLESIPGGTPAVGALAFAGLIMTLIVSWISFWVYSQNQLTVTNENVLQKLQFGLFNDRVSQLNLAKVQDVTVNRQGILSTFFNYGTVEIESAGEQANYNFKYAPEPNIIAKRIVEAHEDYVIRRGRQSNDLSGDSI